MSTTTVHTTQRPLSRTAGWTEPPRARIRAQALQVPLHEWMGINLHDGVLQQCLGTDLGHVLRTERTARVARPRAWRGKNAKTEVLCMDTRCAGRTSGVDHVLKRAISSLASLQPDGVLAAAAAP